MGRQLVEIPNYSNYSLMDLYHALNNVRADLYPHIFAAVEKEIGSRESRSAIELEDCYSILNKEKHPRYAERLLTEIEDAGGLSLLRPYQVTDENRYRTFCRRFWAIFLDAFVVGIPLAIATAIVAHSQMIGQLLAAYLDQVFYFMGLAYYVVMHAACGQTVGKMMTYIKVVDTSEAKGVTFMQAVLRDIVPVLFAIVSAIYLAVYGVSVDDAEMTITAQEILNATSGVALAWWLAEIVTMLFNRKRRAVHDFIARTVVVRVPD